MKNRSFSLYIFGAALLLVSCDKPGNELELKLSQLEKRAAEAEERRRHLEAELAEQRMTAEAEAIERERALIDRERIAMEEVREADQAAMAADLERRQFELAEREGKLLELQENLDNRQRGLTGLEGQLSEHELNLAGREPLRALPVTEKHYASGPTGDFRNFYEPLEAYGSWFNTSDFGYVYQPTVVRDVSWRPYTRGRWAFTNQGWTWVSSEPFGWACYHYGRWALLRGVGWVWVPGSEWAPAWVTWRESPGHIGWAPLPPETLAWRGRSWDSSVEVNFGISHSWFSFVSYSNFGNHIQPHCLPVAQNTVILRSTLNVTYYSNHGGHVFVGGPIYRNVCDRIGRTLPIHRLHMDQSPDFGRGGRHIGSHFRGEELRVTAPQMDADWNHALSPQRVNKDLGRVDIERSSELPEDIRDQFRDSRSEEILEAERVVSDAGSRESFERVRQDHLEENRREVDQAEHNDPSEPLLEAGGKVPPVPPVADISNRPSVRPDRQGRPDRPDDTEPITHLPEASAFSDENASPDTEIPTLLEPAPELVHPGRTGRSERPIEFTMPPEVSPALVVSATPSDVEPPVVELPVEPAFLPQQPGVPEHPMPLERPTDPEPLPEPLPEPVIPETPRPEVSEQPSAPPEPTGAELPVRPEIPEQGQRERVEEARRQVAEVEQESDRAQRIATEKAANEMRERVEEQRQSDEQRHTDEAQRLMYEEALRMREEQAEQQQEQAQRQQQEKMREQHEQHESARLQQEEMRRQQEEQARQQEERARQQEEQARQQEERAKQQEEMRRQQEERIRQQQEQQERMREQQEEQARQQEEMRRQQEERIRQQQEQQERMREQQEEQAKQQEEMRRQQEERIRQQQEQQERSRQQQEQMREQQERARQQQEDMQRQQQERMREQQEQGQ